MMLDEAKLFRVQVSPHIHTRTSTRSIMLDVLIALLPAYAFSAFLFGTQALLLGLVSVLSCVFFEFLANLVQKKKQTIGDLSAAVTGLLLAFCLSSTTPLWTIVLGAFVSIVVVKHFFGGLGQNFVNPALLGRIFVTVSFGSLVNNFPPLSETAIATAKNLSLDIVAGATQMTQLKSLLTADKLSSFHLDTWSLLSTFLGFRTGSMGEVSAFLLTLGFIYLLARKVLKPLLSLSYILSTFVFTLALAQGNFAFALTSTLSGGLFLGAIFMATDYTTSPVSKKGKFIYGLVLGLLTSVLRFYGNAPESVSYAILLGNILLPFVQAYTVPRPFGIQRKGALRKQLERFMSERKAGYTLYGLRGIALALLLFLGIQLVLQSLYYEDNIYLSYYFPRPKAVEKLQVEYKDKEQEVYVLYDKQKKAVAYVIERSARGFAKPIVTRVVVRATDLSVYSVLSIENNETPNLGSKVSLPEHLNQYNRKLLPIELVREGEPGSHSPVEYFEHINPPTVLEKAENQVFVVAGATVSSYVLHQEVVDALEIAKLTNMLLENKGK